eukprot:1153186-Pyramimonas_sp.AAC.1
MVLKLAAKLLPLLPKCGLSAVEYWKPPPQAKSTAAAPILGLAGFLVAPPCLQGSGVTVVLPQAAASRPP